MSTGKYYYILKGLTHYGRVYLWGSASKGMEYINSHDIDIGLITNFKSKEFLKEKCVEIITEYMNTPARHTLIGGNISVSQFILPLHFIIIGDFSDEFNYIRVADAEHMIQFVPKNWRYVTWIRILIKKLKESLLKKS
jgi:predicted nucleotidyltransferase